MNLKRFSAPAAGRAARLVLPALLLGLALVPPAFAVPDLPEGLIGEADISQAIADLYYALGDTSGDGAIDELLRLEALKSVRVQQQQYIGRAGSSSFFLAGSGHFMLGDPASGVLFLLGDLAIAAGSVFLVNLVLPANVKLENLDYFGSSWKDISGEWESLSFASLLPALGVWAGTTALHYVYLGQVSKSARELAASKIESGEVKFEPVLGLDGGRAHFGFSLWM